jgi:hypothetical protein
MILTVKWIVYLPIDLCSGEVGRFLLGTDPVSFY